LGKVVAELSVSLDGFVAGPNPTLEEPLGEGGELLHEWLVGLAAFRRAHGLGEDGEEGPESELVEESLPASGAVVMGRKMYSGGEGPWDDDPNGRGWWGDDPPFNVPVFVVTHHAREPLPLEGGTTFIFVTEGVQAAVEEARAVAGDKNVHVSGGGSIAQQTLSAGLLDELQLHVAPVLLGGGTRLFDDPGNRDVRLERTRILEGPRATHLWYRVVR
jgi:dihydrofolate reductase